ncbi:MAG: diacylglycerol kinase family lipid kinase [Clostridiales bacterium]|jgi:YegS/Rv2252/BmrU family lipid kinase|nr:diacylglycerol kinase family lipid kinase [Clostridiales bacterium]
MVNFIANIKSGHGRGHKNVEKLLAYCLLHNIPYSLHITNRPGHATEIARLLTSNGEDVIAVGGDGTFHEVLNGVADPKHNAVGFIPSGRGNDFTRAAGFSLDPIAAFQDILRGETAYIDYIQVGEFRCLNVAGTGLDIDVLERVAGRTGKLSYLRALLYCIRHFDPYKIEVAVNGETHAYECIMAGVCNGVAIGGNIRISPLSKIDDGKLDVIVMLMPPDGKLLKVLPGFVKGKHMDYPITRHFVCDEVRITSEKPIQLDGEIYRNLQLDCKIVAGGVKTYMIKR